MYCIQFLCVCFHLLRHQPFVKSRQGSDQRSHLQVWLSSSQLWRKQHNIQVKFPRQLQLALSPGDDVTTCVRVSQKRTESWKMCQSALSSRFFCLYKTCSIGWRGCDLIFLTTSTCRSDRFKSDYKVMFPSFWLLLNENGWTPPVAVWMERDSEWTIEGRTKHPSHTSRRLFSFSMSPSCPFTHHSRPAHSRRDGTDTLLF